MESHLGRDDFLANPMNFIVQMLLCPGDEGAILQVRYLAWCKTAKKREEIRKLFAEAEARVQARVQARAEKPQAEALLSALDLAAIQDAVSAPPTGYSILNYGF